MASCERLRRLEDKSRKFGGAVALLVGQLATIQEVRASIPSPGQVRFSFLLCVHPALNGSNSSQKTGLLRRGVANLTQQWLQRYGWEILPHPAHSPDLAPSDFHLFGPLKRHLGGMAFETEDDLISELRNWFDNLDVDFFRVGINSLLSRWQKCIDLHGITLRSSGRVNFNL
ncbi:histone-lysine N-methyltransferase SETMAR [Plakobranchus ocellatus]|uniref:Histone-lysine N-methyltransferase SETMAR n=1 Tax=Plakobranchus ocellatus TaxID=259542 RepID=A0AAV4E217_9GAST|nr:histone-lysine N-methyltransferase SETMAR [Plakobranchus ocellatus]